MIKVLALFGKRPDWSDADFVAHYLERHAPLVAGTAGFRRFCTKYVQNVRIDSRAEIPFDTGPVSRGAITELWFGSSEDIAKAYASEDYLERVRPDELRFVSFDSAHVLLCHERELWAASPDSNGDSAWSRALRIRLFIFRAPREGRTASQLQEGGQAAIDLLLRLSAFTTHVRRYSQSLTFPGMAADLPQSSHDRTGLIEEFSFATLNGAVRFWSAAADDPILRVFWAEWTDPTNMNLMLGRGHTVFG